MKCHGCKHRTILWGMVICLLEKWSGEDNETRCGLYEIFDKSLETNGENG